MRIYFYSNREFPYGAFSNFSAHGFELDGHYWPTAEHYFQAMKFEDADYRAKIRAAKAPKLAADMGRDRSRPLRPDWEVVKVDVMRRALRAKFISHADLRDLLLSTGEEEIIENAPGDYYWGVGADGSGKNMLGKLLMELRAQLRMEADHP
jgi:N-glycosidase YbiA